MTSEDHMPRSLKLYSIGLVVTSAIALLTTSFLLASSEALGPTLGMHPQIAGTFDLTGSVGLNAFVGLCFWIVVSLFASALPVQMPHGTVVSVSTAPIVAAMALGGPVAAGWVAAIGTTELREVR